MTKDKQSVLIVCSLRHASDAYPGAAILTGYDACSTWMMGARCRKARMSGQICVFGQSSRWWSINRRRWLALDVSDDHQAAVR